MMTTVLVLLYLLCSCHAYTTQKSTMRTLFKCSNIDLSGDDDAILDSQSTFDRVSNAVTEYYQPLLLNLTQTQFFRYFKVDLEKSCPFWEEDGQCTMEGCSVADANANEIPSSWHINDFDFGWIGSNQKSDSDYEESKRHLSSGVTRAVDEHHNPHEVKLRELPWRQGGLQQTGESKPNSYLSRLKARDKLLLMSNKPVIDENDFLWTDMVEDDCENKKRCSPTKVQYMGQGGSHGVYVNLLDNPESYTGYRGESARRVWSSIQEDNGFGAEGDLRREKRQFYRLMSGLQASISTHIAKRYFFEERGEWGTNIPLFARAVGSHKERLNNLYFTFLFVLRSVVKAGDSLTSFKYEVGNATETTMIRNLITSLVSSPDPEIIAHSSGLATPGLCEEEVASHPTGYHAHSVMDAIKECREGFDESGLFQAPTEEACTLNDEDFEEKKYEISLLRDSFRDRFRNITRIMDCVTCSKCKVWGKLQILGLGTAIRILLASQDGFSTNEDSLSRQEIISLINTLHQLATSVKFASRASDLELTDKLQSFQEEIIVGAFVLGFFILIVLFWRSRREKYAREAKLRPL